MKKIFVLLFTFCLLLTGCNNKKEEVNENNPPLNYPTYTNEEIRQKLKSRLFEFQVRIKNENKFNLSGEFNAPDTAFSGMYLYKNLNMIVDSNSIDPYIKFKTDVYLKENNIVSEEPSNRIEFIRKTEGLLTDTVDYILEDYIDEKNKNYSKTVNKNNGLIFTQSLQTVLKTLKEFGIDDIPNTVKYSYNRDNASFGMKIKFKDLQGTPVHEYLNILLSFAPELNELLLKFKDDIIININNVKLDTPITTFDININYPTMQNTFEFNILHGSFKLSFKPFIKDDVSKFNVVDTYYKGHLGRNNITKYVKEVKNEDNTITYKGGIVLDILSIIGFSNLDFNKLFDNKKIKIEVNDVKSIKYYDRFSKKEIKVESNIIDLGLLDIILIEIEFNSNLLNNVIISDVSDTNSNAEQI